MYRPTSTTDLFIHVILCTKIANICRQNQLRMWEQDSDAINSLMAVLFTNHINHWVVQMLN